jgi:hypothetical protein
MLCLLQHIEIKAKYHNFVDQSDKSENSNKCYQLVDAIIVEDEIKPVKTLNKKERKKDTQEKREARIKKRNDETSERQGVMKALRKDDPQQLAKYQNYDWNTLRSGEWGLEQTNGLIDCIYYNAINCLRYLIKNNKINKKGLTTLSSNNFYPLDYALTPVQDDMLDILLDKFKKLNLHPTDFITHRCKNEYKLYLKRKLNFYQSLQAEL